MSNVEGFIFGYLILAFGWGWVWWSWRHRPISRWAHYGRVLFISAFTGMFTSLALGSVSWVNQQAAARLGLISMAAFIASLVVMFIVEPVSRRRAT